MRRIILPLIATLRDYLKTNVAIVTLSEAKSLYISCRDVSARKARLNLTPCNKLGLFRPSLSQAKRLNTRKGRFFASLRMTAQKVNISFFLLSSGFFLAACQIGGRTTAPPQPIPTTPAPIVVSTTIGEGAIATVTLPPSATPLPTATPIPTNTPVPAGTATPDPNLGVGDIVYEDKLNGQGSWGWGYLEEGVATFSTAGGQLDAVMVKPNVGPRFSISPDTLKIGDQQVRVTARANLCYDLDEYGLMFRMNTDVGGDFTGYVFKINCGGSARVELLRGTSAEVLVDWTPSPAIVKGAPAENTFMIWMVKDQFHFYLNDKYVASLKHPAFTEGYYGMYLRDRTKGGESISFTNLVARGVTLP